MEARPKSEHRWGGPRAALVAILAGAAALRLAGIHYALPFALLNPDEQNVVPRAWRMAHGHGLDPHFFDWPSLVFYLVAPFQHWPSSPSYLAGRLVIVATGVGGVAAAWWLGNRAYGTAAGAVAAAVTAVETTHVAYSHMAVTDVPLTTGVTICLALLVSDRIELAGLVAGLATAAKYPGVLLIAPLAVAAWRRWRRLAAAVLLAVAAFLAASPFVAVHAGDAGSAFLRVQRWHEHGWLGFEHDSPAPVAFVERLWSGMGPALLVAVAGLAVALLRRGRTDLVLASFVLVYFLDLMPLHSHFDRYVLPLVPVLGALAGRLKALAPVTLLLLVIPLTYSIRDDLELRRTDTRVVARTWIERHVPGGSRIAAESSLPPLDGFRVLALQLPGPAKGYDPNRDSGRLRKEGVPYVVVSGAVADRVLRARDRYPREARFYDDLRMHARRLLSVRPGGRLAGPWVAVYRL